MIVPLWEKQLNPEQFLFLNWDISGDGTTYSTSVRDVLLSTDVCVKTFDPGHPQYSRCFLWRPQLPTRLENQPRKIWGRLQVATRRSK